MYYGESEAQDTLDPLHLALLPCKYQSVHQNLCSSAYLRHTAQTVDMV